MCSFVVAGYFGQRKLMYFPDRARVQPAEVGLAGVEERVLKTPDGARVIAWYGKAQPGQPTLLYFHGNGGSLSIRAERIRRFMAEGWGVYMMTYRGYGGSTGKPTEVNNVADARLAYGALVLEGVAPNAIIAYGESLGTRHRHADRRRAPGCGAHPRCALYLDRRCRSPGVSVPAGADAPASTATKRRDTSPTSRCRC